MNYTRVQLMDNKVFVFDARWKHEYAWNCLVSTS